MYVVRDKTTSKILGATTYQLCCLIEIAIGMYINICTRLLPRLWKKKMAWIEPWT